MIAILNISYCRKQFLGTSQLLPEVREKNHKNFNLRQSDSG
jgi:hypothetical protein